MNYSQAIAEPPAASPATTGEPGTEHAGRFRGGVLLAGGAIIVLAAVLRGWLAPAGLPVQIRSPEEYLHVGRAIRIARGDLDPHFYIYPSLHFYLLAPVLKIAGIPPGDPDDVRWVPSLALAARILSIALGLVAVVGMWLAGRALAGDVVGLLAALLTAVNPVHLYVTTDTCVDAGMSAFFCLALWRLVRVCQAPTVANCAWTGLFAGLAFSCKQPALLLFPLLMLGYGLATAPWRSPPRAWQQRLLWTLVTAAAGIGVGCLGVRALALDGFVQKVFSAAGVDAAMAQERSATALIVARGLLLKLGFAGLLASAALTFSRRLRVATYNTCLAPGPLVAVFVGLLAFAATSPYLLIRLPETLRAILHLAWQGTSAGWNRGVGQGSLTYGTQLFWQFGPLWACAAGLGVVYAAGVWRSQRERALPVLLIALAGVLYFLSFAGHRTPFSWYMLPTAHCVDLVAAFGVAAATTHVAGARRRFAPAAIVGLALGLAAWPLAASIAMGREFLRTPTQWLALQWVRENVPPGSVLVRMADSTQPEVLGHRYTVVNLNYAMEKMGVPYLAEHHADYVIVSERVHDRWKAGADVYARENQGFAWLYEHLKLVGEFVPTGDMTGPHVAIYRVPAEMRQPIAEQRK